MDQKNRSSGVSNAIRETVQSYSRISKLIDSKKKKSFSIKIAETREEREGAYHLAYRTYLDKNFIKQNDKEIYVESYDAKDETALLIVADENKTTVGSITLVFDTLDTELPADSIYSSELNEIRKGGLKIAEISRNVIDKDSRNSKEILILLFNYLAIFAFHNKSYDCLVAQINPRHVNYFKTLLDFDVIGDEKCYPKINNEPAVLLCLPLSRYQERIRYFSSLEEKPKKERSLYPFFIHPEQESLVAAHLGNQFKPISERDKHYFDLMNENFILFNDIEDESDQCKVV